MTARDPENIARLIQSLPPHAIEAEMAVLGSILIDPNCVGDVSATLTDNDFFKPGNGVIFSAMIALFDQHGALDIVQLHQRLIDHNLLPSVGGLEYLQELALSVPSAASVLHYARLVRDKARVRAFIAALSAAIGAAYTSPDTINEIINEHQTVVFKIALESGAHKPMPTLAESMERELQAIGREMESDEVVGVPTGFIELDQLTGGFMPGEMIVIAARPSVGKSALMLNLAEHMATHGQRVGLFSLEMSNDQLTRRLLASRAGVDSSRIRNGNLSTTEFKQLMTACADLHDCTMFVDDTPGLNTTQLRARALKFKDEQDIGILFIDYLQFIRGPLAKRENRQTEVSDISQAVKTIARELQIPVVVLAQLNRGSDTEMRRPRMSDLRESGSIEQDADAILLLHREDFMRKEDHEWLEQNPDLIGVAELIVAKQRNGPTDIVRLTWCSQITRFRDYTRAPIGYGVPKAAQHQLTLAGAATPDDETEDGIPV